MLHQYYVIANDIRRNKQRLQLAFDEETRILLKERINFLQRLRSALRRRTLKTAKTLPYDYVSSRLGVKGVSLAALQRIYLANDELAVLTYSTTPPKHFDEGLLTIQIKKGGTPPPTPADLDTQARFHGNKIVELSQATHGKAILIPARDMTHFSYSSGGQVICDTQVPEPQKGLIYFWSEGKYYIISGFLTDDQLVRVANSLRTAG